jgi:hypothetical protein
LEPPRRVTLLMATMSMPLATTATMSPALRVTTTKTTSTPRMTISPTAMVSTPLAMTVLTSPLPRAITSMILSVLPVREHALRVSTQACTYAESIILSAGGTEIMILSACAESIILAQHAC